MNRFAQFKPRKQRKTGLGDDVNIQMKRHRERPAQTKAIHLGFVRDDNRCGNRLARRTSDCRIGDRKKAAQITHESIKGIVVQTHQMNVPANRIPRNDEQTLTGSLIDPCVSPLIRSLVFMTWDHNQRNTLFGNDHL